MYQKIVDSFARAFYVTLGAAGCVAGVLFVAAGAYFAVSENVLKYRVFFGALAINGVVTGKLSYRFLKHVLTHNDLPDPENDLPDDPNNSALRQP